MRNVSGEFESRGFSQEALRRRAIGQFDRSYAQWRGDCGHKFSKGLSAQAPHLDLNGSTLSRRNAQETGLWNGLPGHSEKLIGSRSFDSPAKRRTKALKLMIERHPRKMRLAATLIF